MKNRILVVVGSLIALAAMTISLVGGMAAHAASSTFGPYTGNSPDGGSCGNLWVHNSYTRLFAVDESIANPSLVTPATIHEDFQNGTFLTIQGVSAGACDVIGSVSPGDGATVAANVPGTFSGFENIEVTSGVLNPNGCTPSLGGVDCSLKSGGFNLQAVNLLVSALYGQDSSWKYTTFSFDYAACTTGLGHWTDSNTNQSGKEVFTGDISGESSVAVNANNAACPQPTPSPTPVPPTPTPVPPIVTPTPKPVVPGLPKTGSDPFHA